MGNDGGSIPKRRELVKNAARTPTTSELKATALESLSHAWMYDPLSSEPLDMENLVSDGQGRLYNYESILKALLPGNDTQDGDAGGHELAFSATGISSLRDVVKLKLKRYAPQEAQGKEVWACPVSLKELGPTTKAVYIVPCGHVFAEVAMKQITEELCPECSEPFQKSDVIPILPTDKAEVEKLTKRLEDLKAKGLTHTLKKDKSAGKKKRKADSSAKDTNGDAGKGPAKVPKKDAPSINNAMTASLTARVMAEQEEQNKRRKLAAAR